MMSAGVTLTVPCECVIREQQGVVVVAAGGAVLGCQQWQQVVKCERGLGGLLLRLAGWGRVLLRSSLCRLGRGLAW